jgi:hypothetical protein
MRYVLLIVGFLIGLPVVARGDGGTLRASERNGNYQISAFTSPTPVRAGPVDISVLVQNAGGDVADDAKITVRVRLSSWRQEVFTQMATASAATNKLFRSAIANLPEAGRYSVEVAASGPAGNAALRFDLDAGPPLPPWLTLWPWFLWPLVVVALFGVHQVLASVDKKGESVTTQNRGGRNAATPQKE